VLLMIRVPWHKKVDNRLDKMFLFYFSKQSFVSLLNASVFYQVVI